jgi:hypothetical protein
MYMFICQNSKDGIATGYVMDALESRHRQEIFVFHDVQTDCGALRASYPMGTGDSFPGVRWPGREADHSPPTNAEVSSLTRLHVFVPS